MNNDYSKQFLPILNKAYEIAGEFGAPSIRTEHFVLAALRNKDGYAFKILSQLRVPIQKMIDDLSEYLMTSSTSEEVTTLFEQQFKVTLSAIRMLQLATAEARKMKAHTIAGEHIILALMHDQRAMDSDFLRNMKEEYLNFDISIQSIGPDSASPSSGQPRDPFGDDEDDEDDDEAAFFSGKPQRQQGAPQRKPLRRAARPRLISSATI